MKGDMYFIKTVDQHDSSLENQWDIMSSSFPGVGKRQDQRMGRQASLSLPAIS